MGGMITTYNAIFSSLAWGPLKLLVWLHLARQSGLIVAYDSGLKFGARGSRHREKIITTGNRQLINIKLFDLPQLAARGKSA